MRSVTCIAMEEGATLVNVPRDLFISFIAAKPRTLQIYLHKVICPLAYLCIEAGTWHFLNLPLNDARLSAAGSHVSGWCLAMLMF